MKCLGLDIGSNSIKGAVLELESGRVSPPVSRPFPAAVAGLAPGRFEVAPAGIELAAREVLEELLRQAPEAERLYCSGQMGGVILVEPSGKAITNYLSWRDQRALEPIEAGVTYLQELSNRLGPQELAALGNELQPGSAASLLFWLSCNGNLPGEAMPATVADYLLGRWCRERPKMHVTQALGLLDLRSSTWRRSALERLGLGGVQLPELTDAPAPLGRLDALSRKLEVFGSYGDQQCALRGAGLRVGELSLNISTGSQVSRLREQFEAGDYQTRRTFEGRWLDTITHLPAGRSLQALIGLLVELAAAEGVALQKPWENAIRLASQAKASDLEIDLAFFAGPLGSSGHIGRITTENLTVGALFQAAFRAMAENYARSSLRLEPHAAWKAIVVSGGLTKSAPLLRQMIAERFAAPLREAADEETMLGLLDLARSSAATREN